ncbi:S24 family peptidase [Paenibacillus sp. GYB004]|uniref:helix-turn-helix domain-containing protein n=1 Tax=Paenibacillus sp. GYB004 TaxID=2994393 RepID=UPI002F96A5EA
MNGLGKYLEQLRVERKLSLRDAASLSGLSYTYIRDIELGTNRKTKKDVNASPQTLKKLSDAYKVDYYQLLERAGIVDEPAIKEATSKISELLKEEKTQYNTSRFVPLIGNICAGDGIVAEENIEEYVAYPFYKKAQPDFALRVKGDSMIGADIKNGDIVFFRSANWAERNGQIVAVVVNGEEGSLKRMFWDASSPKIKLAPENDVYQTKEVLPNELQVCGVYYGHFREPEDE